MASRTGFLASLILVGLVAGGCDNDPVALRSEFKPEDCPPDEPDCKDGDPRIPIGGGDGGVGTDGGGTNDAGGGGDGGAPDAGMPDTGPPPSTFLDVSGQWPTSYVFDVGDYLFGISNLANELDFIDQALRGNLDLGNGILDAIVGPLLDAWIRQAVMTPGGQRFQTVIRTLNGAAHLFEEIEARGQLRVTQAAPSDPYADEVAISATELWSGMYIRLIDRCVDGRQTTSPPHPQPFPQCANTPIPITSSPTPIMVGGGELDVQVHVADFHGRLAAGGPQAALDFDEREVEIEVTKLILMALDLAVRYASANQFVGLEDMFRQTICYEVGVQAEQFALQSSATAPFAGLARQAAEDSCVRLLIDRVVNDGIGGIGVDIEAFQFTQVGLAVDDDGDGRADVLQRIASPDTLDGRFRFVGSAHLGGEWEALR